MNLTTALYLTDTLHQFAETFSFIGICGLIALIIAAIGKLICFGEYIDDDGDFSKAWSKVLKTWPFILTMVFASCLFPAKNTMYMMLGASYLQDTNLPKKVSQALEMKLDDYIRQLSDVKKDEKQ